MSKPTLLVELANIVRSYPIVAVQEVRDKSEVAPQRFLEEINRGEADYAVALSERTGTQADDANSQEQYAYYYDTRVIEPMGEGVLFADSEFDLFQREPHVQRFQVKNKRFSFVLMNIHTRPASAVQEIGALHQVYGWAMAQFPEEDDFIALGDFNASCSYAKPTQLDALQVRGPLYQWVVPDEADTNLASKACAYERIVFRNGTAEDYAGHWGVNRAFEDKKVSDHWPIWAEFFTDRDGVEVDDGVDPLELQRECCRVCTKSQACGDACIPRNRTCTKPTGCACAG